MSSAFTTASFFGQQPKDEKRMDVLKEDLPRATGNDNPHASGADSSGDVRDSDVNKGNGFVEGPAVVPAPKVADATSKAFGSFSLQIRDSKAKA